MCALTLPHFLHAGRFEGSDVRFHTHRGHELVWVTKGECHVQMGPQRLFGSAGTMFVVPQGTPHNQEANYVCTNYVVFQLAESDFDTTPRTLEIDLASPARRWLDDLCDLSLAVTPPSSDVTGALTMALLGFVSQTESKQHAAKVHPALDMALRWMQLNLNRPLKVPELAAHTHFSASHLSELFYRQFGCGPHSYHQKLRLEHAARLLNNPYLRIAEVGRVCGYDDANYFARQFLRHHGVSPAAYRKGNGRANGE